MVTELSEELKAARKNALETQLSTSRQTGVPRTKISAYENGKQIPTETNLKKLMLFYGLSQQQQEQITQIWKRCASQKKCRRHLY